MTLAAQSRSTGSSDGQSDDLTKYQDILSQSRLATLGVELRDRLVQMITDSADVDFDRRILAASAMNGGAVYGI